MNRATKVLNRITQVSGNFVADQSGVTALEYGLIAALVAGAIVVGVGLLGTNLGLTFTHLAASALK